MISKKKAVIGAVLLMAVTFLLTNIFNVTIGNKVIISKSDYQEFQKLSKVRFLKDRIEDLEDELDDLIQDNCLKSAD
mgnify:CR=1 FL=1